MQQPKISIFAPCTAKRQLQLRTSRQAVGRSNRSKFQDVIAMIVKCLIGLVAASSLALFQTQISRNGQCKSSHAFSSSQS